MVNHNNRLPAAFRYGTAGRRTTPRPPCETLAEMIEAEPQIGILIEQARSIRRADFHDYERFKQQLNRIVGWDAKNPRLATEDCYDLAIDALTDALNL